jgi:hypothetical protein
MKAPTLKNVALYCILMMLPAISFSQNVTIPDDKKPYLHREVPDDPYSPNAFGNKKTSPARSFKSSGIFTTQVNVDDDGDNILGDAANEPSIAVDPTNPNRMVIGWRQFDDVGSNFRQAGWGYTTDAGQTWTFPGTIETGIFRSDPVVDFDSNGFVFYNSLTSAFGAYTCKVFKSEDGGGQWNAGVQAHGGDKQWMTIDKSGSPGTGNIYSAWNSIYSSCYPASFTRSVDSGSSFEDCVNVSANPYWGTMTVGNEGELYVVGMSNIGSLVVVKSSNAWDSMAAPLWDFYTMVDVDGALGIQTPVNPEGLLGQASIDVDRSSGPGRGNVYVLSSVYRYSTSDPADVMFIKSEDGGMNWSLPVRINDDAGNGNYQWFGTMSVAPNGRIDAIWLDTRDALPGTYYSALYYSYSMDQGETWSSNEQLSESFDPSIGYPQQNKMGDYFDMESDNTGAHLAWANTLNGEEDVYYSYINPGVTGIGNTGQNPDRISLTNFPNPFSDHATIKYTIPAACKVKLMIYDVYGKLVSILVDENKQAGMYQVNWNSDLPAGYYVCRLTAGGYTKHAGLVKTR